ncbi:SPJ_0845 family protein [Limosilactobacillus gastricus]|nr:SPJ_0845 family protein [Limosilactobacillus gastricus]
MGLVTRQSDKLDDLFSSFAVDPQKKAGKTPDDPKKSTNDKEDAKQK